MDKFTVDLDQVLNDFEYSELTDHYNSRPHIDSTPTVNHSVTKHSINNVFHSLNEYLNTGIDLSNVENKLSYGDQSGDNKIDNSIGTTNTSRYTQESKPLVNSTKGIDAIDILDDKSVESENDTKLNVNMYLSEKETIQEHVDDVECSTKNEPLNRIGSNDQNDILVLLDSPENNVEDTKLTSYIDNIEDSKPMLCLDNLEVQTVLPINNMGNHKVVLICGVDDPTDQITNVDQNNDEVEEKVIPIGFEAVNVDENEIHNLLAELENEDDLALEEFQQVQCNTDNNQKEENKEEENKDKDKELKMENVADILETTGKEKCVDTLKNEEKQTCVEETLPFEEIKETITSKKLIQSPSNTINAENELSNDVEEQHDTNEKMLTNEIQETVDIAGIQDEDKTAVMANEDLGIEIDDTPKLETLEIATDQIQTTDRKKTTNQEKLEQEQVKETAQKCEKEPYVENLSKTDDQLLEEQKQEVDTKQSNTEAEITENIDDTSQEVVNRPQHLPLKENDDGQREINLIGGPGHTPYNNVYINNEIGKQEPDNVSISSASSTTFSDTGSSASTASTEEIRDDDDIASRTVVTQQNFTPNENLETGSRELADNVENVGEELSEPADAEAAAEHQTRSADEASAVTSEGSTSEKQWLGKEAPLWIPDSDTTSCLHCDMKFTVLKRRHHCRACGLVLCSKCCHLRFKLEYLDAEARVCNKCHNILNKDTNSSSSSDLSSPDPGNSPMRRPNPNNPLEYCSTISPLQQVSGSSVTPLPAVMVPVGVLKRKGATKVKSNKSVMFCDGIRPGSDLTNLDNDFNYNNTKTKKLEKSSTTASAGKINRNLPLIDSETNSFIPKNENCLPPLVTITKNDITYIDCVNNLNTVEQLKNNQLTFAILLSLYVHVKVINMNCCINKTAWCFSTEGLINVGQDEIVILLEYIEDESYVPKDVFYHINNIYADAVKGSSIKELGISLHNSTNFLDSKNHAGFVYIRPTFQCLENVIKPKEPYLVGILIHRWETPWAKLFPLRLILRLGAEYRYYPSPVISTRHRDSVFVEIGHTIINLLADFRNFSYTLPQISGLTIHMEDKNTTVTIPVNRYDQIIKSLNNSSDHILAFGGSFSQEADSHLVCIQDTQGNENCYSTHAINIQNKPRKVTGASFIVFNGALKSSSGLTAKSNIVEDGLMIQVLPEHMQQIRDNLRAMKNHTISCGCVNAADESVNIIWGDNDTNFNIGITSSIDGMSLSGIPSIRVHNGKNHYGANGNRIIRWTEVFIIQNGDDNPKNQDPVDISRISENIAKATCDALLNYLDLLVTNNFQKIGIRTTLHVDNVSYCAGSNNTKLPPIYMKSLDNELIPVLHRITSSNLGENAIILELIFRILNV